MNKNKLISFLSLGNKFFGVFELLLVLDLLEGPVLDLLLLEVVALAVREGRAVVQVDAARALLVGHLPQVRVRLWLQVDVLLLRKCHLLVLLRRRLRVLVLLKQEVYHLPVVVPVRHRPRVLRRLQVQRLLQKRVVRNSILRLQVLVFEVDGFAF